MGLAALAGNAGAGASMTKPEIQNAAYPGISPVSVYAWDFRK
jgi:hypothetical protein